MKRFLTERGIVHQKTSPCNPHQNGVAERLNRTLLDNIQSMLHQKNVSRIFWTETLAVEAYIRNRVTSREISSLTTPYELLFERIPNLSHICVFGCCCWLTTRHSGESKRDERATEAIRIGNARTLRGYKLWVLSDQAVDVSRDLQSDDDSFNNQHQQRSPSNSANENPSEPNVENMLHNPEDSECEQNMEAASKSFDHNQNLTQIQSVESDHIFVETIPVRRSNHQRQSTTSWWRGNQILILTLQNEPKTYVEAICCTDQERWKCALKDEISFLNLNKT